MRHWTDELVLTCGCDQVHVGISCPDWRSIQLLQRWTALLQSIYFTTLLAVYLSFIGAHKFLPVLLSPGISKHPRKLHRVYGTAERAAMQGVTHQYAVEADAQSG